MTPVTPGGGVGPRSAPLAAATAATAATASATPPFVGLIDPPPPPPPPPPGVAEEEEEMGAAPAPGAGLAAPGTWPQPPWASWFIDRTMVPAVCVRRLYGPARAPATAALRLPTRLPLLRPQWRATHAVGRVSVAAAGEGDARRDEARDGPRGACVCCWICEERSVGEW